jgi:hypothetical protein
MAESVCHAAPALQLVAIEKCQLKCKKYPKGL